MSILRRKVRLLPDEFDCDLQIKIEDTSSSHPENSQANPTSGLETSSSLGHSSSENYFKRVEPPKTKVSQGARIVRNYAQAICTFAYSALATPYLQRIIEKEYKGKVQAHYFQRSIKSQKKKVSTIRSLRDLLLLKPEDTEKEAIYKKLFGEISEIFIKYFSVNWIFSGKVKLTDEHLKFRHKMLRRIRDPEHFTYLRSQVIKYGEEKSSEENAQILAASIKAEN